MRSLYWKIFFSFWLASILIILTIAWVSSEITKQSSIPAHEYLFMDSYANAAISTYESGTKPALLQWLQQAGQAQQMHLYLLTNEGQILGHPPVPAIIKNIANDLANNHLTDGLFKTGNVIVSHEILSTTGEAYRLAAMSDKPLTNYIKIPWAEMSLRLLVAIILSGLICYLLSIYLTRPLRKLQQAAKSIALGKLNTRVQEFAGHKKDEFAELSHEFNQMAEHLEMLMQSKERLLQDISHELRSPLARLRLAIALGRQKITNNITLDNAFNRMELECTRLNQLIGEILEFARLTQASHPLHIIKVDLLMLIQQIVDDANFEFSVRDQQVIITAQESCIIDIDKRLIHRAIENILRNALTYAASDTPVTITLVCDKHLGQAHITIKDSGPGIPEDELDRIFNPFYRVDSAREKRTGGFGLGLSIAHQAIILHKGQISAHNRASGGLSVKISLPFSHT